VESKRAFLQTSVFQAADDLEWLEAFPGEHFMPRIAGAHTGGRVSVTEARFAAMAGPPLHLHHDADEWFYMMDGRLEFIVGEARFEATKGDVIGVARGTPHAFRNFSGEEARVLGVIAPAGFEQMLLAMKGRPPSDAADLAPDYHIEFVGPPLEKPSGNYLLAGAVVPGNTPSPTDRG
jgi:mannose-6-phosphate isomerase-like protein (cupin superfamily)